MKFLKFIVLIILLNAHNLVLSNNKIESEIPATEDLMKEHGLLNRVLLIYEEIIKRIDNNDLQTSSLEKSVDIIKTFIEDYHEKNEEDYIFPIFEKNNKELKLVKTLRDQHVKGRKITEKLKQIASNKNINSLKNKKEVKNLLKKFINMYRPHEAREDTILFPQVRGLISKSEFEKISDYFEESEKKLFGKDGFENVLKKVEDIEKNLGIYKLEQFTPKI